VSLEQQPKGRQHWHWQHWGKHTARGTAFPYRRLSRRVRVFCTSVADGGSLVGAAREARTAGWRWWWCLGMGRRSLRRLILVLQCIQLAPVHDASTSRWIAPRWRLRHVTDLHWAIILPEPFNRDVANPFASWGRDRALGFSFELPTIASATAMSSSSSSSTGADMLLLVTDETTPPLWNEQDPASGTTASEVPGSTAAGQRRSALLTSDSHVPGPTSPSRWQARHRSVTTTRGLTTDGGPSLSPESLGEGLGLRLRLDDSPFLTAVASDPQCAPRMLQEAEARTMVQGTDPAFVTAKVRLCIHCQ
jgi:hypothetical protein